MLDRNQGHPSLFFCVGTSCKDKAMRWLTTARPRREALGDVHLHFEKGARSIHTERPILFADATIPNEARMVAESDSVGDCPDWGLATAPLPSVTAYSVILGPLTDVVCVFVCSDEDVERLSDVFASWTDTAPDFTSSLPRLVVVVERHYDDDDDNDDEEISLVQKVKNLASDSLWAKFADLRVYRPSEHRDLSDEHRYRRLYDFLLAGSDVARGKRSQEQVLFNSRHFAALAETAYAAFVSGRQLDFVQASRAKQPVPELMQHHIRRFLHRFKKDEGTLKTFVLPYLCSIIMAEASPPGMHKFPQERVFRSLYRALVVGALRSLHLPTSYAAIMEGIIGRRRPFTETEVRDRHRKCMLAYARRWRQIYSDKDCLVCLCRTPEYALPCGHAICAVDVRRYGDEVAPETFVIRSCPLCARPTGTLKYRCKPRTKGINILSIDGGGVRGMIPLQILSLIEQKLSSYLPGVPVQNHFDLAIGTSSGGLIALGTVMKGLSVADCMKMLKSLSVDVFRPHLAANRWVRGRFSRLAMVYLFGSVYPSTRIDRFLQSLFGDRKLMDYCDAISRGAKVAVTASGVPRGGYLMTSYNGAGSRLPRRGWKHIRAAGPASRLKIRDAARSTTAAPGYFLPHTIPGVGPVQDGGLWQNNPQRIGEAEGRSSWPGISLTDVTLSLGTGYRDSEPVSPLSPAAQELPRRRFGVMRTLLGYASSVWSVVDSFMDGEMTHNLCTQDDGRSEIPRRCFRCNVHFTSQPPALDDVTALDRLRDLTTAAFCDGRQVNEISISLLSTLFYFELTTRPMRNRKDISCVGRIVCNLEPGTDLHYFISSLVAEKAEFFVHGRVVPVQKQRVDYNVSRFEQCVTISVQRLDSPFPVSLRVSGLGRDQTPAPISASPFTLRKLVDAQGWNNHFGCDDFGPTSPTRAKRRGLRTGSYRQRKKAKH